MCGIAGIISLSPGNKPIDRSIVDKMLVSIETRGPDARGIWIDPEGQITLANVRLSTSDASALANQPMTDIEEVVVGTFNGEIYNYKELREELKAKGFRFKTRSDTEVLLNCFKAYGAEMLPMLEGQFAFVLYNKKTKEILMARDPMGISPFYYAVHDNFLLFGSEPRALLKVRDLKRELNQQALYHYMIINSTPLGETLYKGIRYLRSGNYISFGLFHDWAERRYADYVFRKNGLHYNSEKEWSEHFRFLLKDAVSRRMVADKEVGVFLSGGLDSTITLGLMREIAPEQRIQAFSVGFEEITSGEIIGELPEARQSSTLFGAEQHDIIVRAEDLINGVEPFDLPPSSILDLVLDIMSRAAVKSGVQVVQTGEGADEIFFGYDHYFAAIGHLSDSHKNLADLFPLRGTSHLEKKEVNFLDIFIQGGSDMSVEAEKSEIFNEQIRDFLPSKFFAQKLLEELKKLQPEPALDKQIMYLDLCQKMAESLMRRMERPTMWNGLEVRLPFLDLRLIQSHFQMPLDVRVQRAELKGMLRKAVEDLLPPDILNRAKIPFGMPTSRTSYYKGSSKTFSKPALGSFFHKYNDRIWSEIFDSHLMRENIFNENYLKQRLLKQKNADSATFDAFLWKVWSLAKWHEKWIG